MSENKIPSNESLIHLEKLNELADGDKDFIEEVLTLFIENTPKELLRIKEALQKKDYKIAGEVAHKLKPAASLIGIKLIERELHQMEFRGLNNEETETLDALYEKINYVCIQAINELCKLTGKEASVIIEKELSVDSNIVNNGPKILAFITDESTKTIIVESLKKMTNRIVFSSINIKDTEQFSDQDSDIILVDFKTTDVNSISKIPSIKKTIVLYGSSQETAIYNLAELNIGDFINKSLLQTELPVRIKKLLK